MSRMKAITHIIFSKRLRKADDKIAFGYLDLDYCATQTIWIGFTVQRGDSGAYVQDMLESIVVGIFYGFMESTSNDKAFHLIHDGLIANEAINLDGKDMVKKLEKVPAAEEWHRMALTTSPMNWATVMRVTM